MKVAALGLLFCSALAFAQTQTTSDGSNLPSQKRISMSESLPASAENKGAWDLGVWGQGGHSVSGGTRNTSVGDAGFRIGKILTSEHGSGWYRGNLEYAVDLIPLYILSGPFKVLPIGVGTCITGVQCGPFLAQETAYGGGFNPFIVKWNFTGAQRISPYLELGGGLLFTNKDVPALTDNINFTPQAAFGVNIFTRERRAVSLDFRYVHISNAGLSGHNPGINTIQGGIGYHWFK